VADTLPDCGVDVRSSAAVTLAITHAHESESMGCKAVLLSRCCCPRTKGQEAATVAASVKSARRHRAALP